MGMFSKNRTSLGAYNGDAIVANENYYGEVGALQITLEGLQNQNEMFNACMEQEFAETAGFLSGALNEASEEYQVMAESAISGFASKIKEMVKKIWEKIKGLFATFIKKINSVIIRDNKKFVEKYKKEVLTKDLSKMKFDYCKPKGGKYESWVTSAENTIDDTVTAICAAGENALDKIDDAISDGDFIDDKYSKIISGSDKESFKKDAFEEAFEDEEEVEGLSSAELSSIISTLTSKKLISDIEKDKKAVDKVFSKYLSIVDKAITSLSKKIPGKSDEDYSGTINVNRDQTKKLTGNGIMTYGKTTRDITMRRLTTLQRAVTISQTVYSDITSCEISNKKFEIAQARKVFAKAVAYNPKKVNESAVFVEAAGDAAYYDVMSSFDDYEM